MKMLRQRREDALVRLNNAVHTAAFGPSGTGKSTSLAIPFLSSCPESCWVVDLKGELYKATADARRKMGHEIRVVDPYGVVTDRPDTLNPFDWIAKDSPLVIDDSRNFADAVVVRSPGDKHPHFNDSAAHTICGLTATVLGWCERVDGKRSPQTVLEIASKPELFELAKKTMRESTEWDGMLSQIGGQLEHAVKEERGSTMTTLTRHLAFLGLPAIARSVRESTFDPARVKTNDMTIYLIVPPERSMSLKGFLRMHANTMFRACMQHGLGEKKRVHFLIDEAPLMLPMQPIEDALTVGRGYGIRMQLYFQSMGQLKKCFPEGGDVTVLSNTTQIFFAVNDNETAKHVSDRLGEMTIRVEGGGSSQGTSRSHQRGGHFSTSEGDSGNRSSSWTQQTRKLLKPEEVPALPMRTAITFVPGMPPIRTTLIRHYEENMNPGWLRRQWTALRKLVWAVLMFAVALAIAVPLTKAAKPKPVRYGPAFERVQH